ncbi:hypothetical protein Hypma_012584 [Hypsizygus marmoreus]|uniref:Tip elongation aberrant protein Tea4 n=1 Tax=Hypsizygus marmoreus TaxID=39966 RepID=A0A369JKL2_HYPMA|nr:hypothetical protein Hypma_012584 [Hypsizygus marmoreus]
MQAAVDTRRPTRQDTFDLREQIHQDDHAQLHAHADAASATYTDDEEHSVLEDDSEGEDHEQFMDDDDDGSSSLSIPNESIDFDLVYSLHSFAATVEGQANVVKGDSLYLMDDSNSYWWLVRVLKTQEVGYIPAENIETPFERLARLNKHRNVDLALPTQQEQTESLHVSQDRLHNNASSRSGSNQTPSPLPLGNGSRSGRSIQFTAALSVHRYPPAIWREEEEEEDPDTEWDDEGYEDEDQGLAEEQMDQQRAEDGGPEGMEPDDGMVWEDGAVEEVQASKMQPQGVTLPSALQAGVVRDQQQQQQQLQAAQEQQQQLQQQRELAAQQQAQQQQQAQTVPAQSLRTSSSRERLNQDVSRTIDPAEATETRKVTVTPTIARGGEGEAYLPSAIMEKQEEERTKRIREEEMAEEARKRPKGKEKMAPPVSSASLARPSSGGKLRKEHRESDDDSGKDKKKKGSVFGGLFGRKKDKKDKNASIGSFDSSDVTSRASEESSRSGHTRASTAEGMVSPTTATALQQQQQQSLSLRASVDAKRNEQQQPHTPERPPQVSQHASQLRQRDQQQQALYQQYLNRSPSSPPEAQPSYGLQSASAVMPSGPSSYHSPTGSASGGLGPPVSRPRPGSLILTQSVMDGQGPGVPELSVIRVFAGQNLQTEATFKTVLLNSSTTSAELIRQATQRFRLSLGEDELGEYFLTVKQVEGGSLAVLRPDEKPLMVFDQLVVEAMEMPKVKRSSVGSISSVASNLSMHPAIKKLPMNDFTDDSAVKFYLNRKGNNLAGDSVIGHGEEADETLIADSSFDSDGHTLRPHYLTVSTNHNVTPERFTSPSFRFPLQLVIYPDDLPDDMIFHPSTEAIVFKDTLRGPDASMAPTVSPALRKKVFVFPKNITVAEVIEIGLERFGISEGVVDGGDEIEDKSTKRRSSTRVRYGLVINTGSHGERELAPSSRVIEAFPRPPTLRAAERPTSLNKRRSVDSTLVLGSLEDVSPDDPVFILRRAISYRNSTYRHRMSAPLDEIALQKLHRDSASSASSSDPANNSHDAGHHKSQPSRQEIIARQREATRANQRAILSAQTNSVRGMDVLLPGNAMLRSSRYDVNDRMRYSYVEPDGETYDISDIVEEELRETNSANRNDLLEGVLGRKDAVGEKLNRVLSKIKSGKSKEKDLASLSSMDSSRRSGSVSEYSMDDAPADRRLGTRSISPPGSEGLISKSPTEFSQTLSRSSSATGTNDRQSRPGTTTPTGKPAGAGPGNPNSRRQPSIASVMSDLSGYATAPTHVSTSRNEERESPRLVATPKPQQRRLVIPKDDFGVAHMLTIIEYKDAQPKVALPPLDPVDALLFGRPIDTQSLHPQVREIYAPAFKQLEELDRMLDDYLGQALAGH